MRGSYAVVTGGGTGIGRALAHRLARRGLEVLIVGRRLEPLQETARAAPDHIHVCSADIGTGAGRQRVAAALPPEVHLAGLVHNAGVLQPVGPLQNVSVDDWRYHQAVNVEGPLFLTQHLLPHLKGGRILHLSSGAAHRAYRGWGAYCTSKAALHMLYQVLRLELEELDIRVGSARPGVVDTPMQTEVRSTPASAFPHVQRFVNLKEEGRLLSPEEVARFLTWLLLDTPGETFAAEEWDARDTWHHKYWFQVSS